MVMMMKKYYIDFEHNLLWAEFNKCLAAKTVKYQIKELNHLKIGEKWYRIGSSIGNLVQIYPIPNKELDDFDLQIQCEEIYANA